MAVKLAQYRISSKINDQYSYTGLTQEALLDRKYKPLILNEIKKLNERRPKRDQAKQLITHLKNLGFNVFGREAMEKFLKEHNLQDLQQAIAEQKEIDTIKQKAIADGTFIDRC